MDEQTLHAIQNMSASQAQAYLAGLDQNAKRKAENLAETSLDGLVRRRDKINPKDQAARAPLDAEIRKRLLGKTQESARQQLKEEIKNQIRGGQPLNLNTIQAVAKDLAFSGNVIGVTNEAGDEVFVEAHLETQQPQPEQPSSWEAEEEDSNNQSSPHDRFKKFARAEVLSDRQFNWETFEKEASRVGLDEDFHDVVREVLNETDDSG